MLAFPLSGRWKLCLAEPPTSMGQVVGVSGMKAAETPAQTDPRCKGSCSPRRCLSLLPMGPKCSHADAGTQLASTGTLRGSWELRCLSERHPCPSAVGVAASTRQFPGQMHRRALGRPQCVLITNCPMPAIPRWIGGGEVKGLNVLHRDPDGTAGAGLSQCGPHAGAACPRPHKFSRFTQTSRIQLCVPPVHAQVWVTLPH